MQRPKLADIKMQGVAKWWGDTHPRMWRPGV